MAKYVHPRLGKGLYFVLAAGVTYTIVTVSETRHFSYSLSCLFPSP